MSWIDIAWPLMAGVSLTLGLVHVAIWVRERTQPALLMFGLAAGAVAVLTILELLLLRAQTPAQYMAVLRWVHVPTALLATALAGFVLLHFRAGRPWLAYLAIGLRLATVVPVVAAGESLRFRAVEAVHLIDFWGVPVSVPIGVPNAWMIVAELGDLALVLYLADAILDVRRRSRDPAERRRVALVCGSMIAFVAIATTWATLVSLGVLHMPLALILPFLGVLATMTYEMGGNVVRATRLERQLEQSETILRGTEQRLQLTADAVGLGMWTWDIHGNEQWFSETGGALLGVAGDGRLDLGELLARVHQDDRANLLRAREEAIAGSGDFRSEFRLLQPRGGVRWLAATGRVDRAPANGTTFVPATLRGVVIDITERRQAEERFRLVVESSPTAMLMVDGEGSITLANAQAERLFGYPSAELLGERIDVLVPSREGSEIVAVRKDGDEVRVEIALTPVRIADDAMVLATITDISERLRTEREIALQRDELAHLSRISVLGEMSGSLAHELNQPLTAVLSNAQAALRFLDRETPDLREVRESLVQIVENDKRAGEVIRRLRAMLRKEQSDHQALHANELVHDVLRLIHSDLLNRNVSTVLDLAPGLPPVLGDRVQLQQVLLNLVLNACEAMERLPGGRVVRLRTRLSQDAGVEVLVGDAGPGIPPDDVERIFAPFVTSKSQGMGLGLAVCRTIVQSHHGQLWASNAPDGGAVLHLRLPPCFAVRDDAAPA